MVKVLFSEKIYFKWLTGHFSRTYLNILFYLIHFFNSIKWKIKIIRRKEKCYCPTTTKFYGLFLKWFSHEYWCDEYSWKMIKQQTFPLSNSIQFLNSLSLVCFIEKFDTYLFSPDRPDVPIPFTTVMFLRSTYDENNQQGISFI